MAVRILPTRTHDRTTVAPAIPRRRAEPRRLGWAIGPPLLVFLLMRVAFALATPTSITDNDPWTWARYDSGHYRSIGAEGYFIEPCVDRGEVDITPTCSNAAWNPGYPLIARGVSLFGMSWDSAAILVSQLATIGVLLLLWNGFLDARPSRRNLMLLVLAGFFPGTVYFLAVFPLSLLVCFILWQVLLFRRGNWYAGAAVGMVASLMYPIALVLGPVSAAWVWFADPSGGTRRRLTRAATVGALISVGTLTVFVSHQLVLGRWDASLEQQRWYGASFNNPIGSLWHVIIERDSYMQLMGSGLAKLLAAQTLLVLAMVTVVVGLAVIRRRQLSVDDLGLTILVVAMWLLPLVNTIDTGLYRRESALVPLVILLRRAPTWMIAVFTLLAVPLWVVMAQKFYWYVLI